MSVRFLGRLADFHLGNPDGIPSYLAKATPEQLHEYGERLTEIVADVTDLHHASCIDGRTCLCNADNSDPEIRRSHVGGTASTIEIAMNAGASVLDAIPDEGRDDLGTVITTLDTHLEETLGLKASAHQGGCGGANGAIQDNEAIAGNPAIIEATAAILDLDEVKSLTGFGYDSERGAAVRSRAKHTATWLREHDWVGQLYVDGVNEREPAGVEELEAPHDAPFHGHDEPAIVFLISKSGTKALSKKKAQEAGIGMPFVANVDLMRDESEALAGQRGQEGLEEAFIAATAKHVATCDRLPSTETPVYVMVVG